MLVYKPIPPNRIHAAPNKYQLSKQNPQASLIILKSLRMSGRMKEPTLSNETKKILHLVDLIGDDPELWNTALTKRVCGQLILTFRDIKTCYEKMSSEWKSLENRSANLQLWDAELREREGKYEDDTADIQDKKNLTEEMFMAANAAVAEASFHQDQSILSTTSGTTISISQNSPASTSTQNRATTAEINQDSPASTSTPKRTRLDNGSRQSPESPRSQTYTQPDDISLSHNYTMVDEWVCSETQLASALKDN